ncbi:heavy metal translocating P-type ATPase [Crenobacter sp. SG2303]|uniref:P-type Zn(2+) transporter n=1 Tax=Crenobacter oryzisoli TaxID=3056844 RepID=A0ABT7XKS0_9NEIS|nr:heavy metal translocating P-type ATPase [Crenobacter sp. SG2303]MDN0074303.1 heavy metal translocating P-type ATPase [Crenobacter sp. SG2303]
MKAYERHSPAGDACCGGHEPLAVAPGARYRLVNSGKRASAASHDHRGCDHDHDHGARTPVVHARAPEGTQALRLRIEAMDCPTEERLIRNKLEAMDGVARLDFNLIGRELTVHHRHVDTGLFFRALESIGMRGVLLEAGAPAPDIAPALSRRAKMLLSISGIAALGAEVYAWSTAQETAWPVLALALVSIASAGLPTLHKGWIALKNLTLNIYFLMTLAVTGALIVGSWPEAAMVVFLFALAEAIEALSLERARNAIRSLTALAPDSANVWQDGGWVDRQAAQVAVGERVRVRTGERVPLDARVLTGQAAVDQAPITGESLPVDKSAGDTVFAGSIVTDGVIETEVTAAAGDSTLARIAAAIQDAQSQRAPTQRFVDAFARYYTPAVVLVAVAVALAGPLWLGGGWGDWLYRALVLLVIACPCALVVSTPVTVVSGLAAAAHQGILVKGGAYLENGHRLKSMAFDKTGTLTRGQPALADVIALGPLPEAEVLRLAASLDEHATHPIAQAMVTGWRDRMPGDAGLPVDDFSVLHGRGVAGRIDGALWRLGNHRLVEELGICSPELEERLFALEEQGKTAIVLCSQTAPVALFGVADSVRAESRAAVEQLKALGIAPVMLTGDNPTTAEVIAAEVGIDDARGNLLPEDKLSAVAGLKSQHGQVGMVGDGVNDAPALARADIGFAMGAAGTATALETADVAIMDDDPRKLALFVRLSRATTRVLTQNIALALGIKAVFLLLAVFGDATLWMAVFADMGASLLVVFNGLRLLQLGRVQVV